MVEKKSNPRLTEQEIAQVAFRVLKLFADTAGDKCTKEIAKEARDLVETLLREQFRRGFAHGFDKGYEEASS